MTPFKSLEQCVQGGKSETFLYALNTCEQIQTYKQWQWQFALCQTIREELLKKNNCYTETHKYKGQQMN